MSTRSSFFRILHAFDEYIYILIHDRKQFLFAPFAQQAQQLQYVIGP